MKLLSKWENVSRISSFKNDKKTCESPTLVELSEKLHCLCSPDILWEQLLLFLYNKKQCLKIKLQLLEWEK